MKILQITVCSIESCRNSPI